MLADLARRYGLTARHVEVLRLMFHEEDYRRKVTLADSYSSKDVFLHYLAHGLARDLPPGPFFDRDYCRAVMQAALGAELGPTPEGPVVAAWLTSGLDRGIAPTPYFDPHYYRVRYPDCIAAGANPLVHFLEHGRRGQRVPSPQISHLVALIASYSGAVREPLWRVLSLMPRLATRGDRYGKPGRLQALLPSFLRRWRADDESDRATITFFRHFVQPHFYEAQLPKGMTVPPGQHAVHCLVEGLSLGLRPSILFSPEYCRAALAGVMGSRGGGRPRTADESDQAAVPDDPGRLFLLWLYVGMRERIVPTPLFDEDYYVECFPSVGRGRQWPFEHFVRAGLKQNRRPHRLLSHNPRKELGEAGADFADLRVARAARLSGKPCSPAATSRVELVCAAGSEKLAHLDLPEMRSLIAQAAEIEPLVARPSNRGVIIWPPEVHHISPAVRAGSAVRRSLSRTTYDIILFMAKCRTAAEAQAAARQIRQLRQRGQESVLLVIVDGDYVDQSGSFGAVVDVLHLAPQLRDLRRYQRVAVLLDLVRGLRPKRAVNLNSRLARQMLKKHGKQLGQVATSAQPADEPQNAEFLASGGRERPRLTPQPEISAIITAHREGAVAVTALRSYLACVAHAERIGLRVQKIAVLDRPDSATRAAFADFATAPTDAVIEVDYGDQGLSRNRGVDCASGRAVAFLDGDDLWSSNWLDSAWTMFTALGRKSIIHPEFSLYFGISRNVLITTDQTDPLFDLEFLRFGNCFDALCLADRETHLRFPYCVRDMKRGYAYEDWHWNCVTIEAGFSHRVARGTIHFKRRRRWSQNVKANMRGALVRPSALFGYDWYASGAADVAAVSNRA